MIGRLKKYNMLHWTGDTNLDTIPPPPTAPRLTTFYLDYLQDHDTGRLIAQTTQHYTLPTLMRLAESSRLETRRAAALVLGLVGTYRANPALGVLLRDPDRSVRLLAENSIKTIWPRDGSEEQRHQLASIMRCINLQDFDEAVRLANILLEECPLYAEARNQRAIALFALGEFQDAIEDSAIVLDLNPYHFGAAIGMAHSYLQLGHRELAVLCFQNALRINPNLETVRRHLDRIKQES